MTTFRLSSRLGVALGILAATAALLGLGIGAGVLTFGPPIVLALISLAGGAVVMVAAETRTGCRCA